MSEKIADYVESLIDEFVDIADDFSTSGLIDEEGFGAFIDYSIEKMREFRTPDTSEIVDSINEYITLFYHIIMVANTFDEIEFDSLMGAFIEEIIEFISYIRS